MVKVLHLLSSNSLSGAERVAINIIEQLTSKYKMAYASPYGPIASILSKRNISFYPIEISPESIQRVVREFQPDIIHAHDFRASIISAWFIRNARIISHLHNNDPRMRKPGLLWWVFNISTMRIAKVVVVSEAVLEDCFWPRFFSGKTISIPNAVNIEEIICKSKEEGVYKTDLLFIGRLTCQKNPLRFIKIFAALVKHIGPIQGVMLGDGELFPQCANAILQHNLQQMLSLKKYVENPYKWIANTKLVIMPSQWEGFGLVAAEALTIGVPVLATPVGGLHSLIKQSGGGILCKDEDEFVTAAAELLKNEDLRKSLGLAGKIWAYDNLNIKAYVRRIDQLYHELLGATI